MAAISGDTAIPALRHWRLVVAAVAVGWATLVLLARGEYVLGVALLLAAAIALPCMVGRSVWPGLVTGRLTRLTRRCWDEWQRRDWDAMAPRMAPDIVMEDVAEGRLYRGPDEVRARLERFVTSFPDGRIEVLSIRESAGTTISQLAFRGTNTGPYDGRPPTGRLVEGRFCEVFTFRRGRIVRVEEYYDRHEILRQLGLAGGSIPAPRIDSSPSRLQTAPFHLPARRDRRHRPRPRHGVARGSPRRTPPGPISRGRPG